MKRMARLRQLCRRIQQEKEFLNISMEPSVILMGLINIRVGEGHWIPLYIENKLIVLLNRCI